jgi:hypothetical protein
MRRHKGYWEFISILANVAHTLSDENEKLHNEDIGEKMTGHARP